MAKLLKVFGELLRINQPKVFVFANGGGRESKESETARERQER